MKGKPISATCGANVFRATSKAAAGACRQDVLELLNQVVNVQEIKTAENIMPPHPDFSFGNGAARLLCQGLYPNLEGGPHDWCSRRL